MDKKQIESMSKEDRIKSLDKIATELHIIANSFAGDETGTVAVYLHNSANNIRHAQNVFNGEEKDEIPLSFIQNSMGIKEPMISLKK